MGCLGSSALSMNYPCRFQNVPGALVSSKVLLQSTRFSKIGKGCEKCTPRISFVPSSQAVAGGEVGVEVKSLARETNVGEVARILLERGSTEVPDHFILKNLEKHDFPLTPHDSFEDLPVVDLSLLESDHEGIVKVVGEALENYGFLQVINHNVPLELLKEHEALAHEFMALPASVKNRGAFGRFIGYNGGIDHEELGTEQQSWVQAFNMYSSAFPLSDAILGAIWPEGNPRVEAAFMDLEAEIQKLSITMHKLMALSLGVSEDAFTKFYDEKWIMSTRWSHYPRNPQPDLVLGAEGHVDPNCLTLLYQDSVGGLQIKHEGKWIGVRPIEGAFVVNVGDIMQVLTNDKYLSMEHRVVTNSKQDRVSIGCFITPDYDVTLSTPEELCTEDNPQKYRPFTPREYFQAVQSPRQFKFNRDKISQILGL